VKKRPPGGDDAVWAERVQRIVAAAAPELSRRASAIRAMPPGWFGLAAWVRPAALIGGVAAVVLLVDLARSSSAPSESLPEALTLGFVAANGDLVALWRSAGIQAEPLLAAIALQAGRDDGGSSMPGSTQTEGAR
jgi:hypothetical protein